jgi:class 3 adenylate cyclase
VRAILFADVKNFSKLPERKVPDFFLAFLRQVQRVLEASKVKPLSCNTWGDGLCLVAPDVRSAADFALRLLEEVEYLSWEQLGLPRDTGVRIGLHTGPVFRGIDPLLDRESFFGSHVTRAAHIEPVTVPGCAFASEQFAACLSVEAADAFVCEHLGVHDLARGLDRSPLYRVVRR